MSRLYHHDTNRGHGEERRHGEGLVAQSICGKSMEFYAAITQREKEPGADWYRRSMRVRSCIEVRGVGAM